MKLKVIDSFESISKNSNVHFDSNFIMSGGINGQHYYYDIIGVSTFVCCMTHQRATILIDNCRYFFPQIREVNGSTISYQLAFIL